MNFSQPFSYGDAAERRPFQSPIKLRHIWVPLALLLIALYRNQRILEISPVETAIGLSLSVLSFLPLFIWASSRDRELPAFQSFCAVHFPYYAYPILTSKSDYMQYAERDRLLAGASVMIFLTLAILIYYGGRNRFGVRRPAVMLEYRQISDEKARAFFTLLLLGWSVFIVIRNFGLIRFGASTNVLTSFANGGGMIALWTLARQVGEHKLSQAHTLFIVVLTSVTLLISFATGSLAAGLIILIVGIVAYSLGRAKIPWMAIILGIGLIAFLNLGKSEMRRIHWRHGTPALTIERIISVYSTWLPKSWHVLMNDEFQDRTGQSLLQRANLIHMQTRAMAQTPSQKPFLWGKTYADIPICLVPRPLWPNKPHGHISTETLGLYYGITTKQQMRTTTVGFGVLAEAWANFGWAGIVSLAVLVGATMRYVANGCAGATPSSVHRLLSIVWISQSFQIEQAMSSWIASFAQTVVAMLIILYPVTHSVDLRKLRQGATSYASA